MTRLVGCCQDRKSLRLLLLHVHMCQVSLMHNGDRVPVANIMPLPQNLHFTFSPFHDIVQRSNRQCYNTWPGKRVFWLRRKTRPLEVISESTIGLFFFIISKIHQTYQTSNHKLKLLKPGNWAILVTSTVGHSITITNKKMISTGVDCKRQMGSCRT